MFHRSFQVPSPGLFLGLLWLLAGGLQAAVLPQDGTQVIALVGGTLIDGTGAPPLKDVAIIIQGKRIRTIGREGKVRVPAGALLIQTGDRYIIPGLIDSHVHYDSPWLHRLYLANGVTTVRDLGSPVERITTLREEINEGNILAPRMLVSGVPINPLSVKALNLGSAREMAEKLVEWGVDGIKVTGYTVDEMREIAGVATENGLLVYGHTGPKRGQRAPGARLAIEAGLRGIEHALGVLEDSMSRQVDVPAHYDPTNVDHIFRYWYGSMHQVVDRKEMRSLVRLMVDREVYFAPTLVNFDRNFARRGTLALEGDPALRFIPEREPSRFSPFGPDEREEWRKTLELMKEASYQFHQAGGLLVAGTDSPGAALPGWSLHQEMELFVQAGLSPLEAIQTATRNNARILGKERELGTVEVGKFADLVILEEDPLEDITHTRGIRVVIREGIALDPARLLQDNLLQFGERGRRHFDRHRRQ